MPKYLPGQIWTYRTRPGEESSRLTVVRVDEDRDYGTIVHVTIADLEIRTDEAAGGVARTVTHMPFDEQAMDDSVLELIASDVDLPDYREGYDLWREAFDRGEAGVFDCEVAAAVEMMEDEE